MLTYHLLGRTVTFEDAAERYFDLQFAAEQASLNVSRQFSDWYKQCGNIQSALDNYLQFAESMMEELAFRPLFDQLTECEIYDISEESYWKHCIGLGESESALETIERQYNAILKRQNAEKEYRADRKAGRSRWRGGGPGISGALKGAAKAATLNAVSGLGHSVFNAVGNAGSALLASMDKSALYKNAVTQDTLLNGIITDLVAAYFAHMSFLNERKENYVQSVFDEDKSSALFENARKLPEKRDELLVQAFTLCPWNEELVKYIFVHVPNDRNDSYAAAQRFSIDLSDTIEEVLAQEYDDAARSSEQLAQAAKKRILDDMRNYGVSESATLNQLETDCLRRLCQGYQVADEAACKRLIEEVRKYAAQERLKVPFFEQLQKRIEAIWIDELEQICNGLESADEASCGERVETITRHRATNNLKSSYIKRIEKRIQVIWGDELSQICQDYETADEAACEKMLVAVKNHKAPDALKAPFLQQVQARIESIWSAADGEIFDNLYIKTDITNPLSVAEAKAYIQSKSRTSSSEKYLAVLNACTPKNIENARLYQIHQSL